MVAFECVCDVCVCSVHTNVQRTRKTEYESERQKLRKESSILSASFFFLILLLFSYFGIWTFEYDRVCVFLFVLFCIIFQSHSTCRTMHDCGFLFPIHFEFFFFWFICIIYCRGFWFLHVWNVNENEQTEYRLEILFVCFLFYFCRTKITNHPRNVRPRTPCCCGASARRMAINMSPYTWVHA